MNDMGDSGLPFQNIRAGASFEAGTVGVHTFSLKSDAMNIDAKGTVDIANRQLNMSVDLEPLSTVSTVISLVPLAGNTAASFTKIYTDVNGPFDDPNVVIKPAETVTKGVEEGVESIGKKVFRLFR